jgi:hypothetical protein
MNIDEQMQLSETFEPKVNAPFPVVSPLEGKAIRVCVACGRILTEPYSVSDGGPEFNPCHGVQCVREDYAPSVRIDRAKYQATGEVRAIAGEPMAHVRARLAESA